MSALNRTGRWNPGGGHYLELIDVMFVTGYVRPNGSASPVVTLTPGKVFSPIYCSPDTIAFKQIAQKTDNGDLYQVTITGFSPDDSSEKNHALTGFMQGRRVLVRFRDYAGLSRLAGTDIEGLELSYELGTDPNVGGSRGYALSLTGTLTLPTAYES